MKASIFLPLAFSIFTKTSATPLFSGLITDVYEGAVTLASTWISGEATNDEVKIISSPNLHHHHDMPVHQQAGRGTNVCGTDCISLCFVPAGRGPDPNDCRVIAEALRYDSSYFDIGTGTNNNITMQYKSCKTFFLNQDSGTMTYCRLDWAHMLEYVAFGCQATRNARGGQCIATNQAKPWLIQVQHSND